jgi:hypothetical protein
MKWHDFAIDEAPDGLPENVVFFAKNGSLYHRCMSASI